MLSEENLKRIEALRKKYPTSQAMVLPVLWIAQEQEGWISREMMQEVAALLKLPVSHILGVVTFYTMFHSKPVGTHHVEVCTNVSCMLRGSASIVQHLEKRLGIKMGETSPDKKWTLSEVECMGACGGAPMLAIGEEYYEQCTPDSVDKVLEGQSK